MSKCLNNILLEFRGYMPVRELLDLCVYSYIQLSLIQMYYIYYHVAAMQRAFNFI